MNILKVVIVLLILAQPAWAAESLVLTARTPAEQTQGPVELGTLDVAGTGSVKLAATRNGTRIVIQALDPGKRVIGQAESVVGPKETLIYVTTKGGMKKLTILWKEQ